MQGATIRKSAPLDAQKLQTWTASKSLDLTHVPELKEQFIAG